MNCLSQNQKEKCCLCSRTLNTWIKSEIHTESLGKPGILCFDYAKEIIKHADQNSTEHETRELLQDVREYPALRKCKEDSFLKKYFKILWVVFVILVYDYSCVFDYTYFPISIFFIYLGEKKNQLT